MLKSEITKQIIRISKFKEQGKNARYLDELEKLKRLLEQEKRDVEQCGFAGNAGFKYIL